MSDDATPFFIRPHRFDDPGADDGTFPFLDGHHRILLDDGERVLWQDQLQVAGYLVGPAAGARELRWTLPRPADVIVTDRRLAFVCGDWATEPDQPAVRSIHGGPKHRSRADGSGTRLATGQIRWQWPSRLQLLAATQPTGGAGQHPAVAGRPAGPFVANVRPPGTLAAGPRVAGVPGNAGPQPGARSPGARPAPARLPGAPSNGGPAHCRAGGSPGGRPAGAWRSAQPAPDDQLLIVCDALRATRQPALALAAGSHRPARATRDLAIVVRRAIAQFRLANPHTVDLAPPERDALRLRAGAAAFADELTEPGRGVTMPGALVVEFLDREDYYRWSPRRAGGGRTAGGAGPFDRSSRHPGSAS